MDDRTFCHASIDDATLLAPEEQVLRYRLSSARLGCTANVYRWIGNRDARRAVLQHFRSQDANDGNHSCQSGSSRASTTSLRRWASNDGLIFLAWRWFLQFRISKLQPLRVFSEGTSVGGAEERLAPTANILSISRPKPRDGHHKSRQLPLKLPGNGQQPVRQSGVTPEPCDFKVHVPAWYQPP